MSISLLFMVFAVPAVRIIKGVSRKFFNVVDQNGRAEHRGYQSA